MAQCVQALHDQRVRIQSVYSLLISLDCVQLVWGDVKLENFVLFPGVSLRMKAIDFDTSVAIGEELTDSYTLRYAPPERAMQSIKAQQTGELSLSLLVLHSFCFLAGLKTARLKAHPSYDSEIFA